MNPLRRSLRSLRVPLLLRFAAQKGEAAALPVSRWIPDFAEMTVARQSIRDLLAPAAK